MARLRLWLESLAAWEWAEHQQRANRRVHFVTNLVMATCLLSLAARVDIPLPAPVLGAQVVPLALLIWVAVALYVAALDVTTVVALSVLLAITTAGFGTWARLEGWPSGLCTLGVFAGVGMVAVGAHFVFTDHHQAQMSDPPGGLFLRTLHAALLGCVPFTLFALLDLGYRPSLRRRLARAGRHFFKDQHGTTQRNWSKTVAWRPQRVHYPKSPEQIADLVKRARKEGRRVRVVGTAYSWSAVAATSEVAMCLKCMDNVSLDLSDPERPLAVVESGVDGRKLNEICQPHGLALPTNVVMETVSFGGLIACGAHGSGWNTKTLSDYVEAIELVDGTGALRRFEAGVDSDEVMSAVRVHLGMLGVVYRATLRLGKNHNVVHSNRKRSPDEVLSRLSDEVPDHEYYDIYWWPFSDVAWVRTWDSTEEPLGRAPLQTPFSLWGNRDSSWSFWLSALQLQAYVPMRLLTRRRESLVRAWSIMTARFTPTWTRVTDLLSATHYRQCIELAAAGCVEFAFSVDRGFEPVREAWRLALQTAAEFEERGQYPLNVVLNVRFIGGSDALLSPAGGNGRTCYIEALGDPALPSWRPFARALSERWLALPAARPHWGKEWDILPDIGARLRAVYGTRIDRFLSIRSELGLDPDDLFTNDLMQTVFALSTRAQAAGSDTLGAAANVNR
ncbi:MAG: FAD-binding protein [Myxococcales bacterium]|nr:FAD-binding protein [Myxococcales bacterium]